MKSTETVSLTYSVLDKLIQLDFDQTGNIVMCVINGEDKTGDGEAISKALIDIVEADHSLTLDLNEAFMKQAGLQ